MADYAMVLYDIAQSVQVTLVFDLLRFYHGNSMVLPRDPASEDVGPRQGHGLDGPVVAILNLNAHVFTLH
jgi:hypothetical protein